jgi:FKBP-type peptidyl-prolyl cis-trans isomerase FkpA
MRVFASLISALGMTFILLAQAPSGTKTGATAKKAVTASKTTAAKKATAPKAAAAKPARAAFANDEEKLLYTIGMYLQDTSTKQLASLELTPAEMELVKRGIIEALNGKPALDLEEWGPKLGAYAKSRNDKTAAKAAGPVKAEAAAYMAKDAQVAGTIKTDSGILYREITPGTGANPVASDTVKVHYKGTLIDGKEFDSSYSRNEPAEFPLTGVVPCWTEGVQRIKVGGKGRLVCPSDLAYGDSGRPPTIPGGAALIFEIELLDIVNPPATPPQN